MTQTMDAATINARPGWRPIGWFYLMTMLVAGGLGLIQPFTRLDPQILELVQFAPAVAVGLLSWRGRTNVRIGSFRGRTALRGLAQVAGAAGGIIALCVAAYVASGTPLPVLGLHALVAPLVLIVMAQFVGACGEEIGWRGWLQPALEQRFSTVNAAIIVGLLWGAWHVQVFARGFAYAGCFLAATVSMSIIIALLVERTPGHTLLFAATFHLLINLGLLFVMNEEDGGWQPMVVFAGASALVCGLALALTRTGRASTPAVRNGTVRVPTRPVPREAKRAP